MMGYKLCTAEKPSVAKDIAMVMGATEKKNGYFIGNGYIVTWAVGHLVTLAEPEEYGEKYKDRNNIDLLPIIPKEWKFTLIEKVKSQFYIIKQLMDREDIDYVIDCGDMGETGHYLQWLIRMYAECKKPVKRFCCTTMTDEAIKKAMANLRDINDFTGIVRGALCKAKGDWVVGMSFSRLFSNKYHSNLTVGRVQTPTLYFVVKRFLEVTNFKISNYYQIEVMFQENFKAFWTKDTNNKLSAEYKDSENRLLDEQVAEKLKDNFNLGKKGKIVKLETKNKATDRPQLYDITELERDGNRIYGYTASQVLEIAQSLYEKHKVMTYPRTDSRFITSDLEPYMETRIKDIATLDKYTNVANVLLQNGLNIDKKIVDDTKVTDHHALLVTEKIRDFDINTLSDKESKILNLVISRMLVSFSTKYLYKETVLNVQLDYDSYILGASGRIPISQGWKAIHKALMGNDDVINNEVQNGEEDQLFTNLTLGQSVNISTSKVLIKKTTPPKLHTEGTLLTAMENAGAAINNNAGYREILKGHGIGTQATRADIIKKLFDVGYVTNHIKGKTNYVVPTKKGINAVKVFPSELLSPIMTADWETKIEKVGNGSLTEIQFMKEFESFMKETIDKCKDNIIPGVEFKEEKEVLGKCLFCQSPVYEGDKNFYCSKINDEKCNFFIMKDNTLYKARTKKNLNKVQITKLLIEKKIIANCLSKTDVKYKGCFALTKNKNGYASFEFSFVDEKKKGKK